MLRSHVSIFFEHRKMFLLTIHSSYLVLSCDRYRERTCSEYKSRESFSLSLFTARASKSTIPRAPAETNIKTNWRVYAASSPFHSA